MLAIACVTGVEGTWGLNLVHHPAFIALMLVSLFSLGLCIIDALKGKRPLSYCFSHIGFFLIVFGAIFSVPDFSNVGMRVTKDVASSYGSDSAGLTVPLPMRIRLQDFVIDYHEDGTSPKQFTSILDIDGQTKTTSVNHPCFCKGYLIYQSDYDHIDGEYSIIRLVRDPWLPIVFLGMALLALGAVLSLRVTWHSKAVIPIALGLAVLFALISLAKIRFGNLMPALRSLWFVPHLIIYMLAYSIMAISLVCGIISLTGRQGFGEVSSKLLGTASSLLILGMLCGAVWAKMAWGDYWTWDAKECWAAVTWILTLVGAHMPSAGKHKYLYLTLILIAFLAMQVTWYGVNYLPSAEFSLHTYNT